MSIAKSIISDMLASLRINSKYFDSCHKKIKYFLNKKWTLDYITREV